MKKMKAFVGFFLLLILGIFVGGCYRIDPGSMEELKGTYELTQYYRTYPVTSTGEIEKTDFIAEKQIKAYLVIDGSAYGYVVYKDNETELLCNCVYITYSYSADDPEAIDMIEYSIAGTAEKPVTEYGKFGFVAKEKKLNQQLPHMVWENKALVTKYTDYTEYKRVDKATDLSYVRKQVGEIPACPDYALAPYDGQFYLENAYYSPYIYYVMDIDALNKKATVYYALKSDGERTVLTDRNVTYQLTASGACAETVSVGDKTFAVFSSTKDLQEEITGEETFTVFLNYTPLEGDIESFIQQAMDEYSAEE